MRDDADALVWFGLGTFHAAFFLALLVTLLHLDSRVGGVLGALDTVRGFALGGVLWAASVLSTRRAFRGMAMTPRGLGTSVGDVLVRGFKAGAVTGWVFLVALVVVLAGPDLLEPVLLFIGLVGSVVALLVGGLVGVAFAVADALIAAAVARVTRGYAE